MRQEHHDGDGDGQHEMEGGGPGHGEHQNDGFRAVGHRGEGVEREGRQALERADALLRGLLGTEGPADQCPPGQ